MELPKIGQQCSVPHCKQLDFLPLQCECELFFCREHFTQHVLTCSSKATSNQNTSEAFVSYLCSKSGCNEKSILPLICSKCNRHFCVTHRHITTCEEINEEKKRQAIEKCNVLKKQFLEIKTKVNEEIEKNLEAAKLKANKKQTANKVQLMRLKAKATGMKGIPIADRIYFNVFNEKYCPDGKAVFVSREWTVGRIVDAISEECKIPNNNNIASAPKLQLFRKYDGEIISNIMSNKVNDLLCNNFIVDGDSLIIKFVENNC